MKPVHRKLFVVFLIITAIGSVAGGAGVHFLMYVSDKFDTSPMELVMQRPFGGKKVINILVLGEDEGDVRSSEVRGRTDTIMVVAIDLDGKRAHGMSIPRDSRVQIPGHRGYQKINAAHAFGGPQLTAQTVANLLNIEIDYYAKTNIAGLTEVVDILGGVEIDIEKDMYYVDRRGGLKIDLKKGHRHLDGDKSLQYVRFRHDRMGDLWRVERQQKFLRALARRLTAPENWTKLPDAIEEVLEHVETNLSAKELMTLAKLAKDIPQEAVYTTTLPGIADYIGGISYFLPESREIPKVVNEVLRFETPKPTVEVLNGSGVDGAAERLAEVLRGAGYQVTRTGNAGSFSYDRSQVIARDPSDVQTVAIAELLNCYPTPMDAEKLSADASVVVIVGRDYL